MADAGKSNCVRMCMSANNPALDVDIGEDSILPERELNSLIDRLYEGTEA
jgi:hypothetical protein